MKSKSLRLKTAARAVLLLLLLGGIGLPSALAQQIAPCAQYDFYVWYRVEYEQNGIYYHDDPTGNSVVHDCYYFFKVITQPQTLTGTPGTVMLTHPAVLQFDATATNPAIPTNFPWDGYPGHYPDDDPVIWPDSYPLEDYPDGPPAGTHVGNAYFIDNGLLYVPGNQATYRITAIDDYTFYHCTKMGNISQKFKDAMVYVTNIGKFAFAFVGTEYAQTSTALETTGSTVALLEGHPQLSYIDDYAFAYTPYWGGILANHGLTLPSNLNHIGEGAFWGAFRTFGEAYLTIGPNVDYMGPFALAGYWDGTAVMASCNFSRINYNATYCRTANRPFYKLAQNTVLNIGDDVTYIPAHLFEDCEIEDSETGAHTTLLSLDRGGSEVARNNFYNKTYIGEKAFYNCTGITGNINVGYGSDTQHTYTICKDAFSGCTGLTGLTIGGTGTSVNIVKGAFDNCTGLQTVDIEASNCTYEFENTGGDVDNGFIYGSGADVAVTIGPNLLSIPANLFANCTGVTSLQFASNPSLTSIGNYAFNTCSNLAGTVAIPNTVTGIGTCAFRGCSSITTLTIGTGLATIGSEAFKNCTGLTTINYNATNCANAETSSPFNGSGSDRGCTLNIGNGVRSIPQYMFNNCVRLTSLYFLNTPAITTIGNYCFAGCTGITGQLALPSTITSYGAHAFDGCTGFNTITVQGDGPIFGAAAFANCTGLTSIYYSALYGTNNETSSPFYGSGSSRGCSLNIGSSVMVIPQYMFSGCTRITGALTTPTTITRYNAHAFDGCTGFNTITVQGETPSFGEYAFANCTGLTSITYNAKNGTNASTTTSPFYGSGSRSGCTVTIGNGVQTIPQRLFLQCRRLKGSLTIPSGITSIGQSAFWFAGFTQLNYNAVNCSNPVTNSPFQSIGINDNGGSQCMFTIGDGVQTIPQYMFQGCSSLKSNQGKLVIPSSVTSIGQHAFSSCTDLVSGELSIPANVTTIGQYAFSGCSNLQKLTYTSATLNTIAAYTFLNCTGLKIVMLHANFESIGERAFFGCSNLEQVYSPNTTPPTLGTYAFQPLSSSGKAGGRIAYVPICSVPDYQSGWNPNSLYFTNIVGNTAYSADCTNTFTNALGSYWGTDTNWSLEHVPTDNEIVIINGNCQLGANTAAVDQVTVNEGCSLTMNGYTLTANTLTNNGTVTGTVAGYSGGGVSGGTASGVYQMINNGTFTGTVNSGTTFVNNAGAIFNIQYGSSTMNTTFDNYGTLNINNSLDASAINSVGGSSILAIANAGDVDIDDVYLREGAPMTISGSSQVEVGEMHIQNSDIIVTGGATLYASGKIETLTGSSSSETSTGTITIGSGSKVSAMDAAPDGMSTNITVTIQDGGQLVHNASGIYGSYQKNISPSPTATSPALKWYTVSSPYTTDYGIIHLSETLKRGSAEDAGIYEFDQKEELEWRYVAAGNNNIVPGHGYLYSSNTFTYDEIVVDDPELGTYHTVQHEADPNVVFKGQIFNPSNDPISVDLEYSTYNPTFETFFGWNFVGNPFTCNAKINRSCYVLHEDVQGFDNEEVFEAGQTVLRPCSAVFVVAESTETDPKVTFYREDDYPSSGGGATGRTGMLNIAVEKRAMRGTTRVDKAIVSFREGNALPKLVLNPNKSKLYIPQNGKDYAIVVAEPMGVLPVNFEAFEDGNYTLSVTPEEAEFSYLHLIDNLTGADVDLLMQPVYTFEASTMDYASRFKLVFSKNEASEDLATEEPFAFYDGSAWVLATDGNATVQLVDMMGRVIRSTEGAHTISTNGMATGVYVLRLVNGDNVRTQKIVVR